MPSSTPDQVSWKNAHYLAKEWYFYFWAISHEGGDSYINPPIRTSPFTTERSIVTGLPSSGIDRTRSMLFGSENETDENFFIRRQRAVYDNFVAPLVRARLGFVLPQPPVYQVPSILEDYLVSVDGGSMDRMAFLDILGTMLNIYGHAFVLTEIPAVTGGAAGEPLSLAQAKALGQSVRSSIFSPLDVPDWSVDDRGNFNWVLLRYPPVTERQPLDTTSTSKTVYRYRLWTRDKWEDFSSTSADARPAPTGFSGPNPLGKVPVEVGYFSRDTSKFPEPLGISGIATIADENREHYNLKSLLSEQLYEQTFASLAVPAESPQALKEMTRSVKGVIGFSPVGGAPLFISPPGEPTRILIEVISKLEARMRSIANFGRGKAEESISARSGDALLVENQDKNADLLRFRDNLKDVDVRVLEMAAAWVGAMDPISVEYPALGTDLKTPKEPKEPLPSALKAG